MSHSKGKTLKYYKHILKTFLYIYLLTIILGYALCCKLTYELDKTTQNISKIQCNESINLSEQLLLMRENLSIVNPHLHFNNIEIFSPISEIPKNVFNNISFNQIWIYNSTNLKKIHRKAFMGSTRHQTRYFTFYQNFVSQLENEPNSDYDLYKAIKTLKYLRKVYLSLATHRSHEIPDNVFKPIDNITQHNLHFVEWYGYYNISRIGDNAFYHLPNIDTIVFKYTNIEKNAIKENTFQMRKYEPNRFLNIEFYNTSLTQYHLEKVNFTNIKRKINLNLILNKIDIINETIFRPFFDANPHNFIQLGQNPLKCSEESYKWLCRFDYIRYIYKGFCYNQNQSLEAYITKICDKSSTTIDSFETITTDMNEIIDTESNTESNTNSNTESNTESDKSSDQTQEYSSPNPLPSPIPSTTSSKSPSTLPNSIPSLSTSTTLSKTPSTSPSTSLSTSSSTIPSTSPSTSPSTIPSTSQSTSPSTISSTSPSTLQSISPSTTVSLLPSISSSTTLSTTRSITTESNEDHISHIKDKINDLIENTRNGAFNSSEDLNKTMNEIKKIQNHLNSIDFINFSDSYNITSNIVKVLSNLLNQENAWYNSSTEQRTDLGSKILQQVHFTSFFLIKCSNDSQRIEQDNIIVNTYLDSSDEINFHANDSLISIPEEVFQWNTSPSFAALISKLSDFLNISLKTEQKINTQIISYSLNTSETHFQNNVLIKYSLKHKNRLEFGDQMMCTFWNFSLNSWSKNGCDIVLKESNRTVTVCQCNHLTNFAAIMDISNREDNSKIKSILTEVFCGVSLFCLVLTILLLLKPQRNNSNTITNKLVRTRTLITLNLSLMLSIVNIIVIFGLDQTDQKTLCQIMSAILLFCILSSFAWMLLEGYHLYKMTVKVFDSDMKNPFYLLFGYGTPVVVIFFGFLTFWIKDKIIFDALIGDYFCWISTRKYPDHIWLVIGPALIAIVFNILIMIILMTKVFKSKSNQNNNKFGLRLKQIFGMTSLLFNLGITWVSFLLYIKQFGSHFSYFSYVFIVLNGSQGIFIFIYHLAIYMSKEKKFRKLSLRTSFRIALSIKWSTRTTQTQLD